jgi:SAM-dependent methyltransferase
VDAEEWDRRYAESGLVWSAGPNVFVAAALASATPGRALDLAAGEGRNAIWLAERGWAVTAVDFSLVGLDKGRALLKRRSRGDRPAVEWVHADAVTHDPGSGFDLALVAYLQLPADQRRAALRRAFGALREGGTLFVVAHDRTNLEHGTGGPREPAVLYTAEDVLADLDGERFEVVRAERVVRQVAPPAEAAVGASAATAYDALVHLVRTGAG